MPVTGNKRERSVHIGNIAFNVTEETLREIFASIGQILSFNIIKDKETGKSKGYAFCEYADVMHVESAIRNLNDYECGGRGLRVNYAGTRSLTRTHAYFFSFSLSSTSNECLSHGVCMFIPYF